MSKMKDPETGSGSVPLTNGSGSGRPKNMPGYPTLLIGLVHRLRGTPIDLLIDDLFAPAVENLIKG